MSLAKISKFIFHKHTIKIVSLIFVVGWLFIIPAFAAGDATTNDGFENIKEYLDTFISLCSRLRVVLAILAGKLMTNDFVYGAFIHMDVYLWKIWNIMKNFANFALIGIVLVSIVKGLIGKEALDIKKIITNTLLAGILIQASRFMMGAIIDLSTVATTGISAFPMSYLKSNTKLQDDIRTSVHTFQAKRIVYDPNSANSVTVEPIVQQDGATSDQDMRDAILPNYNSVSGPFIFLGMGTFQFQNYLGMEVPTDSANLTFSFAISFFFLFFFTIGLLLLFVANIMRVGLLRIFIIGSPFLILIQLFKLKEGDKGLMKIFKLSNLIAIVFKPVIFVAGISLMFIVVTSIQYGMGSVKRENNLNGVKLGMAGDNVSTLSVEGISDIQVSQEGLFGEGTLDKGQNVFSYLLMLLLTLFLMWRFIKLSLTLGGGPIEEVMTKVTGRAEDIAKTAPLLPIGGGGSIFGVQKMMDAQSKKMARGFGMDTKGRFDEAEKSFQDRINREWLGIKPSWSNKDITDLKSVIMNQGDFMGESIKLGKNTQEGLSLSNSDWKGVLEEWLQKDGGKRAMESKMGTRKIFKRNKDFETTFKDNGDYCQALHELMGGDAAAYPSRYTSKTNKISYDQLTSTVYHRSSSAGEETTEQAPKQE